MNTDVRPVGAFGEQQYGNRDGKLLAEHGLGSLADAAVQMIGTTKLVGCVNLVKKVSSISEKIGGPINAALSALDELLTGLERAHQGQQGSTHGGASPSPAGC